MRIIGRATGIVQHIDVEASSEEEVIERFDPSMFDVRIIPPDEIKQAKSELYEHYHQQSHRELESSKKASSNALLFGIAMTVFFVVMVFWVILANINSSSNKQRGNQDGSKMSDAEKALWIKTLQED
ncbi:hypothetical protein [Bremerella volcania]|uniref:hypothetical protein n=1 Tax=Bremerella volcania TaxID=2527984 RepID=UPI0011A8DDCE|nr:hypothetical protein [Bremerella volcania]